MAGCYEGHRIQELHARAYCKIKVCWYGRCTGVTSKKLESLENHINTVTLEFNNEQMTILTSLKMQNGVKSVDGWRRYRDIQRQFLEVKQHLTIVHQSLEQALNNPKKKNINAIEDALEFFDKRWQEARHLSMIGILSQ